MLSLNTIYVVNTQTNKTQDRDRDFNFINIVFDNFEWLLKVMLTYLCYMLEKTVAHIRALLGLFSYKDSRDFCCVEMFLYSSSKQKRGEIFSRNVQQKSSTGFLRIREHFWLILSIVVSLWQLDIVGFCWSLVAIFSLAPVSWCYFLPAIFVFHFRMRCHVIRYDNGWSRPTPKAQMTSND